MVRFQSCQLLSLDWKLTMRIHAVLTAATLLVLAGCASTPQDTTPASIVNVLSFDNAMSGKRDAIQTNAPVESLANSSASIGLGQIKQCGAPGTPCQWGILKAKRSFGKVSKVPNGVAVEVDVMVDVNRTHKAEGSDRIAMAIPSHVSALQATQSQKRTMVLPYGQVHRMDFKYGVGYELCAVRLDAKREPLDKCATTAPAAVED
jgi:hypothetical protein